MYLDLYIYPVHRYACGHAITQLSDQLATVTSTPVFLMSHLLSHLSYSSCDVQGKNRETPIPDFSGSP